MFTGLIETVGTLKTNTKTGNYRVLTIESDLPGNEIVIGESIACDGVCLTVISKTTNSFTVEASQESLTKSIIGGYQINSKINLERAMRLGDRLGGHLVSGHVDTIGKITGINKIGASYEIVCAFDKSFDPLIINKGSIAINGISLTVNTTSSGQCSVNIIPHTWQATNLASLSQNSPVNLEFDMLGKYIQKQQLQNNPLTIQKLKESGW